MRRLLAFVCFSALLALLVLGALPGSAAEQVTLRWTVWAGSPEELNIYQLQAKVPGEEPGNQGHTRSGPFAITGTSSRRLSHRIQQRTSWN